MYILAPDFLDFSTVEETRRPIPGHMFDTSTHAILLGSGAAGETGETEDLFIMLVNKQAPLEEKGVIPSLFSPFDPLDLRRR